MLPELLFVILSAEAPIKYLRCIRNNGPDGAVHSPMRSSEQYRQFAEECLRFAKQTNNGNHRQILEEMAEAWSTLAEEAEKKDQAD